MICVNGRPFFVSGYRFRSFPIKDAEPAAVWRASLLERCNTTPEKATLATIVRVYPAVEETGLGPHLEFNLPDFGGQLPSRGDLIMKPRAHAAAAPPAAADEIWEVMARYFDPGPAFDAGACLHVLVRARRMTPVERALHEGLSPAAPR